VHWPDLNTTIITTAYVTQQNSGKMANPKFSRDILKAMPTRLKKMNANHISHFECHLSMAASLLGLMQRGFMDHHSKTGTERV
jgi:hypothetical protein